MKITPAVWVNIFFRGFVALAYALLGMYVAFFSAFSLGDWQGVPIVMLLGILFICYGLFRVYRAYLYFKDVNEEEYGNYED